MDTEYIKQYVSKALPSVHFIGHYPIFELKKLEGFCGDIATTDNALYVYNGKFWDMIYIKDVIKLKVLERIHSLDRGYRVHVDNPEDLPITTNSKVLISKSEIPIISVDKLNDEWGNTLYWEIITKYHTKGDYLEIKLK